MSWIIERKIPFLIVRDYSLRVNRFVTVIIKVKLPTFKTTIITSLVCNSSGVKENGGRETEAVRVRTETL